MSESKSRKLSFIKWIWRLILIVLFLLVAYAFIHPYFKVRHLTERGYIQENLESIYFSSDDHEDQYNCRTPRHLFINFYYKALGLWTGFFRDYYDVMNCISPKVIRENDFVEEAKNIDADKLVVALLETSFKFQDIPDSSTDSSMEVALGKGANTQTFYIKRKTNGDWYFTKENFTNPRTLEKYQIYKKINGVEKDSVKNLSLPILAYANFTFGVTSEFGFTLDDAITVMDLSWIPSVIRYDYGRFVAYAMNKVLDTAKVNLIDIPGAVTTDNENVVIYVDPKSHNAIYLTKEKETDKTGFKWVFPQQAQIDALDMYFNNLMVTSPRDPFWYSFYHDLWENIPILKHGKYGKPHFIIIISLLSILLFYFTYKIFDFFNKGLFKIPKFYKQK